MSGPTRVRRPVKTAGTVVKPLGASVNSRPAVPSPPSTSRYTHIPSTVDTGPNAHNTRPPPPRTSDPFSRVSSSSLASLLVAHSNSEETVYALVPPPTATPRLALPVGTADAPSYLLLDVRSEAEYNEGHIITAVSFPPFSYAVINTPPSSSDTSATPTRPFLAQVSHPSSLHLTTVCGCV